MNIDLMNLVNLECKVHQLKFDLTRLWSDLGYSTSSLEYLKWDDTAKLSMENKLESASQLSLFSFYTAYGSANNNFDEHNDSISENSFDTAFDFILNENLSDNTNQKICRIKKQVSFCDQIEIFHTPTANCKPARPKLPIIGGRILLRKFRQIKERLRDYWTYEGFYLRYNWYRIKKRMPLRRSRTKLSDSSTDNSTDDQITSFTTYKTYSATPPINWFIFFKHSPVILETDLDEQNTKPVIYRSLSSVPTTDFGGKLAQLSNQLCYTLPKPNTQESYPITKETEENLSPYFGNHLVQYLIERAQSPLELKVAASLVNLNLPSWYQKRLVTL